MTWLLVLAGIALMGLGLAGNAMKGRTAEPARNQTVRPPQAAPKGEAWEILVQPIEREELIKIPERSGRDRRFVSGVSAGLGAGLLVSAVVLAFNPKPETTPPAAVENPPPPAAAPDTPAPADQAPKPPDPPAPPPKPANVNFVVESGDLAPTVAANLKAAGLITNEQEFLDRVSEQGLDTRLKAGTFIIQTDATLDQVIAALTT